MWRVSNKLVSFGVDFIHGDNSILCKCAGTWASMLIYASTNLCQRLLEMVTHLKTLSTSFPEFYDSSVSSPCVSFSVWGLFHFITSGRNEIILQHLISILFKKKKNLMNLINIMKYNKSSIENKTHGSSNK